MRDPILITGAARSGTSMVAGIINLCGAFGGKMSGPTHNNPKGMFENAKMRSELVKPYFRNIQMDTMGQYPLPDTSDIPIHVNWRERVEDVIEEEGYDGDSPWFYKGAKMCLMWPQWNHAFPDSKWIIVRRRTADITNSCVKTGFMSAFLRTSNQQAVGVNNERDGWTWWVRQHEQRFVEMITEGLNVKIVWPERMVNGDYSQIMDMIEWLGLKWTDEVYKFIEPKLWKARKGKRI